MDEFSRHNQEAASSFGMNSVSQEAVVGSRRAVILSGWHGDLSSHWRRGRWPTVLGWPSVSPAAHWLGSTRDLKEQP